MSGVFFHPNVTNVMYEAICEPYPRGCNTDQQSFKAYLSRWYALTTQLAPFTAEIIMPRLQASAQAAAATCIGGNDGRTCGLKWYLQNQWDGIYGVGEQMAAMEVIQSNLIPGMPGPFKAAALGGQGNSTANPSGGGAGDNPQESAITDLSRPSKGQVAAAAILTLGTCAMCGVTAWYMLV
jgi:mannan endo-1,6-alpha-mannosidase